METDVKLTKLASCAGCGAKVGAGTLVKMLEGFRTHTDPRLIVGYDKSDDASVYVVSDDTAIVQTTDFFPPIVDDPFLYGQIAATNALSDVYAMGGAPKLALNIMCLADSMDDETVREILRGGYDKAYEAGAIITGGHTIHGAEPIYGLAVTGFVHPKRVLTNSGAKPGDVLILTKPLGVGIVMTASRMKAASQEAYEEAVTSMTTLNKYAAEIFRKYDVHACTDVTGFGLLVHLGEMLGENFSAELMAERIPYIAACEDYVEEFYLTAAGQRNRNHTQAYVTFENVPFAMQEILFDPQTSGGLLLAVASKEAESLRDELQKASLPAQIVGEITEKQDNEIVVSYPE